MAPRRIHRTWPDTDRRNGFRRSGRTKRIGCNTDADGRYHPRCECGWYHVEGVETVDEAAWCYQLHQKIKHAEM